MKKTQIKDALRNIRKRIVSFLSLCLVVALGLGALFTTRYMGAGLAKEISDYYADRNFKNYEMISSLGVSEGSIAKIKSTEGVTAAEGVIQADGTIAFGDQKRAATIITMTHEVSVPELLEGNVPTTRSECMIGEDVAEVEGIKIGDKLKIALTGLDALGDEPPLHSKEFTVTGLMHHPDYLRRRDVNTVVLPLEAFNEEATDGLYTRVFIRTEDPAGAGPFSDAYFEKTQDIKQRIEDLTTELGEFRTEEVKDKAYATIDEEWDKALEQMQAAEDEIAAGEAELDSKLAEGRNELNSAQEKLNKTIAKYRKEIKDGEKKLKEYQGLYEQAKQVAADMKKQNDEFRKLYNDDIAANLKEIASWEAEIKKIEEIKDKIPEEYEKLVKALAQKVIEKQDLIQSVVDFFNKPAVEKIANEIKRITKGKLDLTKLVKRIASIDVANLVDLADKVLNGDDFIKDAESFIEQLKESIASTKELLEEIDKKDGYIKMFDDNKAEIESRLGAEEKKLKDAKKKLAEEQKKYQKQIDAGWSRYYAEKAKYEAKIEEAKLLLEENREEAEAKLQEAKDEVESMEACRWIALDRKANAGYVDAASNLGAIRTAGNIFGILFMIVTIIVCLSTLIIIIDEQKTLVGTTKAFGFFKKEILGKYLIFGAAAAIAGSAISTVGGYILSGIIQRQLASSGMYQTGVAPSIVTPGITLAMAALITVVTIIASIIACGGILRSPAAMLMKGSVLRRKEKKKKEASKAGTLYSRLIMRNMAEDKARVLVTIAIIAFCCMLMGMGISMKLSYNAMISRQIGEVNKYDFRVTMNDDVTDEQSAKIAKVLESSGVAYLPATSETMLYRWDDRIDGLQMICADPERLGEFYAVTDPKTKEPIEIPADGVLIQNRMNESYGMDEGDRIPILDTSLKENEAEIKGTFTNYVGRTVVASPEAYKSIFGKAHEVNAYYVKLEGADETKVKSDLLAVTDGIGFTQDDEFKTKFESVTELYNVVVYLITGIAILISFMILTNLSNIFLMRRKTELSVMRVNGFSIKQAKGYLSRETVITTLAGLVLGLGLGVVLTPPVIATMQQPDLDFVKSFHPIAWAIALALEAVFAILINSVIFNKVKHLNLRDIV